MDQAALGKASRALAFIEQITELVEQLQTISKLIPKKYQEEMEVLVSKGKLIVEALDIEEESINVIAGGTKNILGKTKIDRLKIGGEIVRRIEQDNCSYKELAKIFDLDPSTISRFYQVYKSSSNSVKAKIRKASVFDTTEQLEEVGAMLYRALARLEGNDDENYIRGIGELRQIITTAEKFMSKVSAQTQLQQIRTIVYEILVDELPDKRRQIEDRFRGLNLESSIRTISN